MPTADLKGTLIGDYILDQFIRHSQISSLYNGRHHQTNAPVFIELFNPNLNDTIRRYLQTRLEALAILKHDSIPTVLHHDFTSDQPYTVTAHQAGTRLTDKIKQWQEEPLSLPILLNFIWQLSNALAAAHEANLFHHTLRPRNILVTNENHPIILDFIVPPTPIHEPFVENGTISYLSPEQSSGAEIDARSNIYSLGVIFYEILAGHRPRLPETSWGITNPDYLPQTVPLERVRPDLSPVIIRVVNDCLWRHPADRFASCQMLSLALETAVALETQPTPSPKWPIWLRWAVPVAVGVILLIILAAIFFSNRSQSQPTETPIPAALGATTAVITANAPTTPSKPTATSIIKPVTNAITMGIVFTNEPDTPLPIPTRTDTMQPTTTDTS
jgi:serine/threonine-protein kinase